jgi:hypothetical protein
MAMARFFMKFDLNLMKLTNNDSQYSPLNGWQFSKKGERLQNNCLGKILVRTCESLRTLLDFFDFLDFLVLVFCGLFMVFLIDVKGYLQTRYLKAAILNLSQSSTGIQP